MRITKKTLSRVKRERERKRERRTDRQRDDERKTETDRDKETDRDRERQGNRDRDTAHLNAPLSQQQKFPSAEYTNTRETERERRHIPQPHALLSQQRGSP